MREPTVARDRERGATGVIDTLSLGYATVNRHPWIVVIPILLDLFFWLGPRVSLASLVQRILDQTPVPTGFSEEMLQSYSTLQQSTVQSAQEFNLLSLLSTNFPGLPSLVAGKVGAGPVFELTGAAAAALVALFVALAGTWLASLYYTAIGGYVRGDGVNVAGLLKTSWSNWLRLASLLLLALFAALLVGVPVLVAVMLALSMVADAASLVVSFLWVAAIWVEFYLFFVVDAVVISDAGPLRAIRSSFRVVRHNLGASLGLIVLVWLIMLGMPVVWGAMLDNPITAVMAILGNAYVSTGLAAASMIFYRERFGALRTGVRGQGNGVRGF